MTIENFDIPSSTPLAMLTLLNIQGIGGISVVKLCKKFKNLNEIISSSPTELKKIVKSNALDNLSKTENWRRSYSKASRTIETAEKLDVRTITFLQDDYPYLLGLIDDKPPVLFVKGELNQGNNSVACVGTREPSEYGVEVTKRLVQVLAKNGFSIVSGLALGVDSISHQETLELKKHTVAVLANGLNNIYPKENRRLAEEIIEKGGALISEQQFDTPATIGNLVNRDRIQSGLSIATFVMQTGIEGGSMNTVRFSLLQGRRVYVPVPPEHYRDQPESEGIVFLMENKGYQLSSDIKAKGKYKKLLNGEYSYKYIVRKIHGREDYPNLLNELEDLAIDLKGNN